ncbi:MAG TPA: HAMP domain-containing sensor histidine kinase [Ktedonobacterales bacterium]|jgi:signal transduction histidine kinase|nr:HAMP domain-containing sensor histidine kinase [Ktedonobacterales bacterium]
MMWNLLSSLRLRLVLMFMLVVMIAVGTVALMTNQATTNNLQTYTQAKNLQQVNSVLLTAPQQHLNQHALQTLTEQLAQRLHERIILFDQNMRVIADSDHTLIGQVLPLPGPSLSRSSSISIPAPALLLAYPPSPPTSTFADPNGFFIVQSASAGPFLSTDNSPETTFLTAVNHSLWLAVLIAGLTALLLALLFASMLLKPLRTLKAVAYRMEQGDLTQRVAIKGNGELCALAHAFNAMADSLSRAERLRRNLVSDVAHELRNPLMNIRGTLELVQEQVIEPTPETLASLYEETSLLSRIVADLQDLSLAEAGQLRLKPQVVALEEVVGQATQMVQPALARKNLTLCVKIPPDLPAVEADPERVAQILRNLLSNAITHTPNRGKIIITASHTIAFDDPALPSLVAVSVRDSGVGIAPEHLPNLFERFYRVDASRARATGGTGLGLAIVKQLVEAQDGQVTVESQPGKGACFTFTLPAVECAP